MVKMLVFDLKKSEKEYFNNIDTSDFEITYFNENLCEETKLTAKEYEETVIISLFIPSRVTASILDKFKNLRIISTRSNEYNHIDIDACRKRNIAVMNVNSYGSIAIAQYVIGVTFAMIRNIPTATRDIQRSHVQYEKYEGYDISNLSIGVIGTGSVGEEVCKLAHKVGMKIYANDIKINNKISDYTEYTSLNNLLIKSDVITLHIPYIKECYHMISSKEIEIMKDGAYLINTSNGNLVDTKAIYDGIKNNKLSGVALDVVECNEWRYKIQDFSNKTKKTSYECLESTIAIENLMKLDNVIITPRISYDTTETTQKILELSINNIKDYYKGKRTNRIL